jgi:DNA-binding MarR family transcriptional regulator
MFPTVLEDTRTDDAEKEILAASMIEIAKLTRDLLAMHLATIALSPGEDDYLLALSTRVPTDLVEAAEELGVRRLVAAKAYERLSVRNLVKIEADTVTLTDSGNEIRSQISTVYRMVGEDIAGRLSTNTIDVVKGVLAEVRRNMKRALKQKGQIR